jgi:hypothetical protein
MVVQSERDLSFRVGKFNVPGCVVSFIKQLTSLFVLPLLQVLVVEELNAFLAKPMLPMEDFQHDACVVGAMGQMWVQNLRGHGEQALRALKMDPISDCWEWAILLHPDRFRVYKNSIPFGHRNDLSLCQGSEGHEN